MQVTVPVLMYGSIGLNMYVHDYIAVLFAQISKNFVNHARLVERGSNYNYIQ